MKSIVYIATLAILLSCGNNDTAPSFIYERSTEVDNLIQLSALELDLRSLAILENSDADNSIGLESEYFRQHYRFYTDEGKRQLVDLLIREKSKEEIKVLFGLLLSQFTVDSSKLSTLEEYLHLIQRAEEQNKAIEVLPLDKTLFLVQLILDKDTQRDDFTIEDNHEVMTSLGGFIFNWAVKVDFAFNLYSKALEIHYLDLYEHEDFYVNNQFGLKYLIGVNLNYLEDTEEIISEELEEQWLRKLENLAYDIEKKAFATILQEQLINPSRNSVHSPIRTPHMDWDMSYNSSLGGCSGHSDRSRGANLEGYHFTSVIKSFDNVLDLTNERTLRQLGVSRGDIINTRNDEYYYEITHQIGSIARDLGFQAIRAPSARTKGYVGTNLIILGN